MVCVTWLVSVAAVSFCQCCCVLLFSGAVSVFSLVIRGCANAVSVAPLLSCVLVAFLWRGGCVSAASCLLALLKERERECRREKRYEEERKRARVLIEDRIKSGVFPLRFCVCVKSIHRDQCE